MIRIVILYLICFIASGRGCENSNWCVEIIPHDAFGDGWGDNIALKVWGERFGPEYIWHDCTNHSLSNWFQCFDADEAIRLEMITVDPPAKESWEIYWTVNWMRNTSSNSELVVGDFETNMTISCDLLSIDNEVDFTNKSCDNCVHPPKKPPKGSPSARRTLRHGDAIDSMRSRPLTIAADEEENIISKPKPQWPFPFELLDTEGKGWFSNGNDFVSVPQYSCDGSEDLLDNRLLVETLTSPEYVISTIDRVHALRRGTICGNVYKEVCEEVLPDGKYVFRVTGALSMEHTVNTTLWHFCGSHGTAMEELEFKLIRGKCFPGPKISSAELCCGPYSLDAKFSGSLRLKNVHSDLLSEFELEILESHLREAFASVNPDFNGAVVFNSWNLEGSSLLLQFTYSVKVNSIGVGENQYDLLENLGSELFEEVGGFFLSGNFISLLHNVVNDNVHNSDLLSAVNDAQLESFRYDNSVSGMTPGSVANIDAVHSGEDEVPNTPADTLREFTRALVGVSVSILGLLILASMYSIVSKRDYRDLPNDSVSPCGKTSSHFIDTVDSKPNQDYALCADFY